MPLHSGTTVLWRHGHLVCSQVSFISKVRENDLQGVNVHGCAYDVKCGIFAECKSGSLSDLNGRKLSRDVYRTSGMRSSAEQI